ncbi:uncharacterized protein BO80DRAFT_422923 [Aspergillus ibericus CBS 121593]|uniref:Uncharacterized protein n=1 Tax=Aspergillus ibericus CBS 121593 TaxID=1448316 RepID=A0A395H7I0_9EURO|nr:hypothetical protein BO80DRAFT_422923 [Aspergillus ibericus CBS 121593]RAL03463.1 hypothetical protein BO80DRAFT_422923 [Aspergillus ibericus CBS 121593]
MSDHQDPNPHYAHPVHPYRRQHSYGPPLPSCQLNPPIIHDARYSMNPPSVTQRSSTDYYTQRPNTSVRLQRSQTMPLPQEPRIGREEAGRERSLEGSIFGGASGYCLGHMKGHEVLGPLGGDSPGNYLWDRMDDRKREEHNGWGYEFNEHDRHCRHHCGHGFHCDCARY